MRRVFTVITGVALIAAVRHFAAGLLQLRQLHEGGAVGLSACADQLDVFRLHHLRRRLHLPLLLAGLSRHSRRQVSRNRSRQGRRLIMPLSPFALCIIAIVAARRARPADRPFDDRRLDLLSAAVGARPRHRGRADPQRPVQQLRPARDPAVHPRRRSDEHRQPDRPAAAVLPRAGRPLPRRSRPRQRRRQHDLRRHVRLGDRRRGRHRPHHHRHDDQGRQIPDRLCRRDHGLGRDHRADHSAVDPDGALCADLGYLDRLSVPRRLRAGHHARHRLHDHELDHRAPPELSGRAADSDARNPEDHDPRVSRR